MKKRILSLLLAVLMVVAAVPMTAISVGATAPTPIAAGIGAIKDYLENGDDTYDYVYFGGVKWRVLDTEHEIYTDNTYTATKSGLFLLSNYALYAAGKGIAANPFSGILSYSSLDIRKYLTGDGNYYPIKSVSLGSDGRKQADLMLDKNTVDKAVVTAPQSGTQYYVGDDTNGYTPFTGSVWDPDTEYYTFTEHTTGDDGYTSIYNGFRAGGTLLAGTAAADFNFAVERGISSIELSAIIPVYASTSDKYTVDSRQYKDDELNGDTFYLLSASEFADSEYGLWGKKVYCTTNDITSYYTSSTWLRSVFSGTYRHMGFCGSTGVSAIDLPYYLRTIQPAFNLDPDSVLFASDATSGSGKVTSTVGTLVTLGASDDWKLTLIDSAMTLDVDSVVDNGSGSTTVNYENASYGANTYLSMIITDKNNENIYGYAKLAALADASAASGSADFTLPDWYNKANYNLSFFTETVDDTVVSGVYTRSDSASAPVVMNPDKAVASISVTTAPTKVIYKEGETFDAAGMVVTANYVDTTSAPVTEYQILNTAALTSTDTSVTIRYQGKTTTQEIAIDKLNGITITTAPTKTSYYAGDVFSTAGMVVKGNWLSGDVTVNDYTVEKTGTLDVTDTEITISYMGKSTTQSITVAERSLKILFVGNSFSLGVQPRLANILNADSWDFVVGDTFHGSETLGGYAANTTTADRYTYCEYVNSTTKQNEGYSTLTDALAAHEWDIVVLQPSGYECYDGVADATLQTLYTTISTNAPTAEIVYFDMFALFNQFFDWTNIKNYAGKTNRSVWLATHTKTEEVLDAYSWIVKAIPAGTAIENARATELGAITKSYTYASGSYTKNVNLLGADGCHLNEYGQYINAMTFFCSLTGKTVDEISYVPSGITNAQAAICKQCVADAIANPGEIYDAKVVNGTLEYDFVYNALDGVESGDTIKLMDDISENIVVAEGKNVTLDLNGHNITVTTGDVITNNGTLTITGTGVVSSASGNSFVNNGTLTLCGGTYSNNTAGLEGTDYITYAHDSVYTVLPSVAPGEDPKLSGTNVKKSLSLLEDTVLNFKVAHNATTNDISEYTDWKLVVENEDGTELVAEVTEWHWNTKHDRLWCAFPVRAKNICTTYTVHYEAKNEAGQDVVGESFQYSVAAYCDEEIAWQNDQGTPDQDTINLCNAIKTYGACAAIVANK